MITILAIVLMFCLLAYAIYGGLFYFLQESYIFRSDLALDEPAELPIEVLKGDNGAYAWIVRSRSKSQKWVVFFHGNSSEISQQSRFYKMYAERGFNVLLPEYLGYGGVPGPSSETGIVKTCVSLIDLFCKEFDVCPKSLVYHGYSMGGGVASQVALQRPPNRLVLEATFASMQEVIWNRSKIASWFITHKFRSDLAVKQFKFPYIVIRNKRDEVIPYHQAPKLTIGESCIACAEFETDHTGPLRTPELVQSYQRFLFGFLGAN